MSLTLWGDSHMQGRLQKILGENVTPVRLPKQEWTVKMHFVSSQLRIDLHALMLLIFRISNKTTHSILI